MPLNPKNCPRLRSSESFAVNQQIKIKKKIKKIHIQFYQKISSQFEKNQIQKSLWFISKYFISIQLTISFQYRNILLFLFDRYNKKAQKKIYEQSQFIFYNLKKFLCMLKKQRILKLEQISYLSYNHQNAPEIPAVKIDMSIDENRPFYST